MRRLGRTRSAVSSGAAVASAAHPGGSPATPPRTAARRAALVARRSAFSRVVASGGLAASRRTSLRRRSTSRSVVAFSTSFRKVSASIPGSIIGAAGVPDKDRPDAPRRTHGMSIRPAASRAVRAAFAALLVLASASSLAAAAKPKPKKKPPVKAVLHDYAHAVAVLHTERGDVTIRFFFDRAPNHVKHFIDLAPSGFYAGRTDAKGLPVTLKAEFNETAHKRGIVSMARSSAPDSASSQFFIVLKDYPSLDHQYTAFGEVVKGMDVVDRIVAESNPDPANANLGRPRAYQKLVKVDIVEESAAPAATPAPAKKG